jgi:hypothetical protein
MFKLQKPALSSLTAVLMLFSLGTVNAALVNYEIEGTVLSGNEFGDPNAFNLAAGDIILATGVVDDSLFGAGTNTALFGSGNTLSIDVNGTIFTDADDPGASLTFTDGALFDFDFTTSGFNSSFTFFDDFDLMLGEWGAVTTTPVPVPAAVWLFGSGLLALTGIGRRKISA